MSMPLNVIIRMNVLCKFPMAVAMNSSLILKINVREVISILFFLYLTKQILPNMAELRAAHTDSRRDGHNCHPSGLDHGFEYASKLNAS